jgi:predicted  nucleic acid-binding Zn-ribbon protein
MNHSMPVLVKHCAKVTFSGFLALLISPAVHAQTNYLSSTENYNIRIATAGKFKESSSALLSELLACVATDKPSEKLKKITKDYQDVKDVRATFASHRAKIEEDIQKARKEIDTINRQLAVAARPVPLAKDFKAISDRMQTAKQIQDIKDPITREVSAQSSRVVELVNRNLVVSFTDSQGRRRTANAANTNNLDAEQRAVLEALSLSWMTNPAPLTGYEYQSTREIKDKNPLRRAAVNAGSLSDVDAQALASGANSLIPKANIWVESVNVIGLPRIGSNIVSFNETLARSLITTDVTIQDVHADALVAIESVDTQQLAKRKDDVQHTLERLSKDSSYFYEVLVATDTEMKRLEIEFKRCSEKLSPPPAKEPATKVTREPKRNLLEEDAEAFNALKATSQTEAHKE